MKKYDVIRFTSVKDIWINVGLVMLGVAFATAGACRFFGEVGEDMFICSDTDAMNGLVNEFKDTSIRNK